MTIRVNRPALTWPPRLHGPGRRLISLGRTLLENEKALHVRVSDEARLHADRRDSQLQFGIIDPDGAMPVGMVRAQAGLARVATGLCVEDFWINRPRPPIRSSDLRRSWRPRQSRYEGAFAENGRPPHSPKRWRGSVTRRARSVCPREFGTHFEGQRISSDRRDKEAARRVCRQATDHTTGRAAGAWGGFTENFSRFSHQQLLWHSSASVV